MRARPRAPSPPPALTCGGGTERRCGRAAWGRRDGCVACSSGGARGCAEAQTSSAAEQCVFNDACAPGSQEWTRLGRRLGWRPKSEVATPSATGRGGSYEDKEGGECDDGASRAGGERKTTRTRWSGVEGTARIVPCFPILRHRPKTSDCPEIRPTLTATARLTTSCL